MRKEFEENEESENKSENNLETQDEIDDETFQKILEKEFIEREKRITAALFADDDVEDIKFTKSKRYVIAGRRLRREKCAKKFRKKRIRKNRMQKIGQIQRTE